MLVNTKSFSKIIDYSFFRERQINNLLIQTKIVFYVVLVGSSSAEYY